MDDIREVLTVGILDESPGSTTETVSSRSTRLLVVVVDKPEVVGGVVTVPETETDDVVPEVDEFGGKNGAVAALGRRRVADGTAKPEVDSPSCAEK